MKRIVPLVLMAGLLVACGPATEQPLAVGQDATPSARSVKTSQANSSTPDPPFAIEGPYGAADLPIALDGVPLGSEWLILDDDLTTGWIVRPALIDVENRRYADLRIAWLDDGRLGIGTISGAYRWEPGGTVEPANLVVPDLVVSTVARRAEVAMSSDDAWYSRGEQSDVYFDTLVGRVDDSPSFRLTRTIGAEWSPIDPSVLIVQGSPCVATLFDLLLFDADDGSLRSLTDDLPDDVSLFLLNFAWHPDGQRVAVETWGIRGERSRLVTVDVNTGVVDSIPLARHAAPVPLDWSADGQHLLVRFEMAHGGLFCEQRTDWAPSSVERLGP